MSSWHQSILRLIDNVLLMGMGREYHARLAHFADNIEDIDVWRKDQQDEWDRLTKSLALLATMNAAILAISPQAPPLAFSFWLGAAGLSVCGLFIVQYFPIKAFSISDRVMEDLVQADNGYIDGAHLAIAIASPSIIAIWSSLLFIIGVTDYVIETPLGGLQYKVFALVPISFGLLTALLVVVLSERSSRKLQNHGKIPLGSNHVLPQTVNPRRKSAEEVNSSILWSRVVSSFHSCIRAVTRPLPFHCRV